MRARIALHYSGVVCQLREVVLKNKPEQLLAVSPKGTVPVLLVPESSPVLVGNDRNGEALFKTIEQSIDIVDWALHQSDPDEWLAHACDHTLIQRCDGDFKYWLDRYKYADRFPENPPSFYFEKACVFLHDIEPLLVLSAGNGASNYFIKSAKISVLDIAIFPFIRQFAFVDKARFDELELPKLQSWLSYFLDSPLFLNVMNKYSMWIDGETEPIEFGR